MPAFTSRRCIALFAAIFVLAITPDAHGQEPGAAPTPPSEPAEAGAEGSAQEAEATAPAAPAPRVAPVPEPEAMPVVREVRIRLIPEEQHRTQGATVRQQIQLQPNRPLDRDVVSDDIRRIYSMGFFDDIQAGVTPQAGGVVVTYHVVERPVVGEMEFDGVDEEDTDIKRIIRRARARTDRFYDPDLIKQVAQDLRNHFESQGHYLADVDVRTEPMEGNRIKVTYHADARAKLTIRTVEILGNDAVPDAELVGFLANQPGGLFAFMSSGGTYQRSMLLQRDVEVIRQIYASKGYAYARVGTPTVSLLPDREGIHIAIPVIEGEKYEVAAIDLTGDILGTKEELLALVKLAPGDTFNIRTLFDDLGKLTHRYRDDGYAFADVSFDLRANHEERTLGIIFRCQKGSRIRVGRVEVTGNSRTLDHVVRRELRLNEGDYYSETLLEKSKARVQRTGFFTAVQVRKKVRNVGDGEQVLDLDFHVRRQQTGSFQVGVGFSSFEAFTFNAQIAEQNFLGRGQSLSFNALVSSLRTIFSISFHEPYFLDSPVAFGFNIFNLNEIFPDFERERRGGSLTWGYHITDELIASATYRLEHQTTEVGGSGGRLTVPVSRARSRGVTSAVEGRLAYDTRDNRIFPRNGQLTSLSYERAEPAIGSDTAFNRYAGRTRWFFPFVLGSTLRFNGSYSFATTNDPEGLPISERFFAGGIFDIRGFPRYSLGPELQVAQSRDPGAPLRGFVLGGTKKLVFNAELEFPIFEAARIAGVVFADAGNTYGEGDRPRFNLDSTRESTGFGIRWWSPVGPLRFEWGFPLDRKADEDKMVFEFTIGSSF